MKLIYSSLFLLFSLNAYSQLDLKNIISFGANTANFNYRQTDINSVGIQLSDELHLQFPNSNWFLEGGIGLSYIKLSEWEDEIRWPSDIDPTTFEVDSEDKSVFERTDLLYFSIPLELGYAKNIGDNQLSVLAGIQTEIRLNQSESGYYTEQKVKKELNFQVNEYNKIVPYLTLSLRYGKMINEENSIALQASFARNLGIRNSNVIVERQHFNRTALGLSLAFIHKI